MKAAAKMMKATALLPPDRVRNHGMRSGAMMAAAAGAVMLLLDEQDAPLTEAEQKLVQTVAGFLGRQMEN